jgi:hypothetical protein
MGDTSRVTFLARASKLIGSGTAEVSCWSVAVYVSRCVS